MLEYIKREANMTLTENGAATFESTGSQCLDLFATIGALRRESDAEIIRKAGYDIHTEAQKLQEIYLGIAAREAAGTKADV